MKKIMVFILILVMFFAVNLGESFAQPKKEIRIYSARFGGIVYMAGVTLTDLLNKNHPWLRATNLESAGTIENIKRDYDNPKMKAETFRLGVSIGYFTARKAQAPFKQKYEGMKPVFSYAISTSGYFATTNPKIQTPKDLIGKKVGVGEKGSAFLAETQFLLRDCWGIWDKIKPEYLGFKAARDAFMDGLIDAVYCPGNMPGKGKYAIHPLMKTAIQLKKGLHFIELTKEDLERGGKEVGWPLSISTVPAKSIAGKLPVKDATVFYLQLMAWAYEELPEDIVYEITKIAHQNIDKFNAAHAAMRIMSPEVMAWLPSVSEKDVHAGALKYYKEQGIPLSIGGAKPKL